MPDYFEIDRLIEDLAKVYSTACATTWFKVSMNKKPTVEEFRTKVVDFMRNFEYTLSSYLNLRGYWQYSISLKILSLRILRSDLFTTVLIFLL